MVKTVIIFYSKYGHMFEMAKAAAEGASKVKGAEVSLRVSHKSQFNKQKKVKETLPLEVLVAMGADKAAENWKDIPDATPEDLENNDVVIFCTPTTFGMMASQMKTFIDSCGQVWMKGSTIGKVAGVMASSGAQHGGQESTLLSFINLLFHFGFIVGGLPYSFTGQMGVDEIKGGSPYGATTIVGPNGIRLPSKEDLEGAQFQAEHLTKIGAKLFQ
jgi:NAD(P)H dehydrogenase (quinone)